MEVFTIALLFLSVNVGSTLAVSSFINPPPFAELQGEPVDFSQNPAYANGSVVPIRWSTSEPAYTITLWHLAPMGDNSEAGAGIYAKGGDYDTETGGFDWLVQPYGFNLSVSPMFYMTLWTPEGLMNGSQAISGRFNITTTSAAVATTSSTSTATRGGEDGGAESSASAEVDDISSEELNDDDVRRLGLGLGLGLGLPMIAALLAIGFLVFRRRTHPALHEDKGFHTGPTAQELSPHNQMHELYAHQKPVEAPS